MSQTLNASPSQQTEVAGAKRPGELSRLTVVAAIVGVLLLVALTYSAISRRAPQLDAPDKAKQFLANEKWMMTKSLEANGRLENMSGPDQARAITIAGGDRDKAAANVEDANKHYRLPGAERPNAPDAQPPAFIQELNRRRAAEGR